MPSMSASSITEPLVIHHPNRNAACVAHGNVSVWEIVREWRRLGSIEALRQLFPRLPEADLAAAIGYAKDHPAEIDAQIDDYEQALARRRAEYPFSR